MLGYGANLAIKINPLGYSLLQSTFNTLISNPQCKAFTKACL